MLPESSSTRTAAARGRRTELAMIGMTNGACASAPNSSWTVTVIEPEAVVFGACPVNNTQIRSSLCGSGPRGNENGPGSSSENGAPGPGETLKVRGPQQET